MTRSPGPGGATSSVWPHAGHLVSKPWARLESVTGAASTTRVRMRREPHLAHVQPDEIALTIAILWPRRSDGLLDYRRQPVIRLQGVRPVDRDVARAVPRRDASEPDAECRMALELFGIE